MSYTAFGEFVRVLRIRKHQVMGDMAKLLGVSTPFLSAVENGKKSIPHEWLSLISEFYSLSSDEQAELQRAIEESQIQFRIIPKNAGLLQRKAALEFARSFDSLDEETAQQIMTILGKKRRKY